VESTKKSVSSRRKEKKSGTQEEGAPNGVNGLLSSIIKRTKTKRNTKIGTIKKEREIPGESRSRSPVEEKGGQHHKSGSPHGA